MTPYQPNYEINQTPATSGGSVSVMGGTFLTGLLIAASVQSAVLPTIGAEPRSYNVRQAIGTFSQLQNMFTGEYNRYSLDFEGTIANFYAALLAKQEPLGKEFEKILYDNLWELYVDY